MPSDATIKHHLVFERAFNEDSADRFIAEYKDTITFAKLGEPDTLSHDGTDSEGGKGDLLQGLDMKPDLEKKDPAPAPGKPPGGEPAQDELQYRLSKDGVALVYRGRVTRQVMQKLISYLKIDLDAMPESETAKN